ncbi:MAG TPA: RodZ domain-containing protein [Gallionella sp.]|nr:RodZ domain-containing protein [Gallionella sp.]
MEQIESNDISPVSPSSAALGRTLREARERLGLSVADVANQIKFAPRQIEALEADNFERLPEMAYVRGFVRSYAKLLQLDAQPLLALLPEAKAASEHVAAAPVDAPYPTEQTARRQTVVWLAAALLVLLSIGIFALWPHGAPQDEAKPAAKTAPVETPLALPEHVEIVPASPVPETDEMAASAVAAPQSAVIAAPVKPVAPQSAVQAAKPLAQPVVSPAQSSVPTAKPPVQAVPPQPAKPPVDANAAGANSALRIVFDEEAWAEVKDKFGKTLSSQVNPRGSELHLEGRAPFALVIGHAATAHVYLRGKPVDLKPYMHTNSTVARLTLE